MPHGLEAIAANISQHGLHIYRVGGAGMDQAPRYTYSIGLTELGHSELILAGGSFFESDQPVTIVKQIADEVRNGAAPQSLFDVENLGSFTLRPVCDSWMKELLLGALDYYSDRDVTALQVVPQGDHFTIDIPDLGLPWTLAKEPIWRWQFEQWPYEVPADSVAATDLPVLRGEVTAALAARWDSDYWEVWSDYPEDYPEQNKRLVPLGMLLAADADLQIILSLGVGKGVRFNADTNAWEPWG